MVRIKGKQRTYIIAGAVIALLIVIVGIALIVNGLNSDKKDPYKQVETTNIQEETTPADSSDDTSKTTTVDDKTEEDETSTVDPATLATVDIEPMGLTVSYVKDAGGFEFYVLRTASGTQYVEFSSPELVGTKCTDDKGVFASIIEDPSANDSSTLSKTTTVDGTKYGLSLADATCTKDPDALKKYQSAFTDAFSLLKKID